MRILCATRQPYKQNHFRKHGFFQQFFFLKNNYSNDMFPFCQPKRAASIKNKNSLVSLREEISTSTFFELSNGCRNNAREILSQLRSAPTEKVYKNKSWKLDGVFSIICFCSTLSFLQQHMIFLKNNLFRSFQATNKTFWRKASFFSETKIDISPILATQCVISKYKQNAYAFFF